MATMSTERSRGSMLRANERSGSEIALLVGILD